MPYIQAKAEIEFLCDDCNKELKYKEEYLFGREMTRFYIKPCECQNYGKEG